MKLFLLRHAKSSRDNPELSDHDRPLNDRGIEACSIMADYINENNLFPEKIISSTAKRAKDTIDLILEKINKKIDISYTDQIYLNGYKKILEIIKSTNSEIKSLMIVGHNPDMEELAEYLLKDKFNYKFSTAALAIINFEENSWKKINKKSGELDLFITPKNI